MLGSDAWHPGVIGIVASRLVERYYRPTVLIAVDAATGIGRGSGRSIQGVNLYEAFKACAAQCLGFGGHRMAAGLSLRAENVEAFAAQFEAAIGAVTAPEDFIPRTVIDTELEFTAINERALEELARLEPHGMRNPEPIFLARNVLVQSRRVVGDKHLKLYLRQDKRAFDAIAFGLADAPIHEGDYIDVLFSPENNEWNGSKSIQLRLRDYRPSEAS